MTSAYPVTGSFSRSAVNNQTGARTQLDYVFTGVSSGLQPESARLVLDRGPPWLSDHFGVLVSLHVHPYATRTPQPVRSRHRAHAWPTDFDGMWGP